jgi:NitT/TauT family transport system substrate-binding protein
MNDFIGGCESRKNDSQKTDHAPEGRAHLVTTCHRHQEDYAMTMKRALRNICLWGLACASLTLPAEAMEIAVANYGSSVSGMPWAVALEKGFFKEAGADITAIIGTHGGSSEVRNMIAGNLPYIDSSLVPMLKAIKGGADLRIVSENGHTTAQFVWIVNPDSPIKDIKDIKGKRITFTTPLSTSQSLDYMLVEKAGLKPDDVKLLSTGAYGAALTALQNGGVDIALVAEPVYTLNKNKFRVLFWSRDLFSAINNTVGVSTVKLINENPKFIRGIILGHRKAVEYMKSNRKDSAAIIAKVYKMEPAVVEEVLAQLMDHTSLDGATYYSLGDIYPKGLDAIVDIALKSGDMKEKIDWRPYVDQSLLPDDLKRKLD